MCVCALSVCVFRINVVGVVRGREAVSIPASSLINGKLRKIQNQAISIYRRESGFNAVETRGGGKSVLYCQISVEHMASCRL